MTLSVHFCKPLMFGLLEDNWIHIYESYVHFNICIYESYCLSLPHPNLCSPNCFHIYTSGCIVLLPANITEVRVLVLSLAPQDLVQNPLYKWSLNWNKPPLLSLGHKWSKVCKSALDMTWGMSMISWIWHPVLVKLKF